MEKGDISNEVVPLALFVFEGYAGLLPDKKSRTKYDRCVRRGRWREAAATFTLNENAYRTLWDAIWHIDLRIGLVTFLPPELGPHLTTRLQLDDIPFGTLETYDDAGHLARVLTGRPNVIGVYHSDTRLRFTFGSKGHYLAPHEPHRIGSL